MTLTHSLAVCWHQAMEPEGSSLRAVNYILGRISAAVEGGNTAAVILQEGIFKNRKPPLNSGLNEAVISKIPEVFFSP